MNSIILRSRSKTLAQPEALGAKEFFRYLEEFAKDLPSPQLFRKLRRMEILKLKLGYEKFSLIDIKVFPLVGFPGTLQRNAQGRPHEIKIIPFE